LTQTSSHQADQIVQLKQKTKSDAQVMAANAEEIERLAQSSQDLALTIDQHRVMIGVGAVLGLCLGYVSKS